MQEIQPHSLGNFLGAKLGQIWKKIGQIWAKVMKIWANLIRFGQSQNVAFLKTLITYGYADDLQSFNAS